MKTTGGGDGAATSDSNSGGGGFAIFCDEPSSEHGDSANLVNKPPLPPLLRRTLDAPPADRKADRERSLKVLDKKKGGGQEREGRKVIDEVRFQQKARHEGQ